MPKLSKDEVLLDPLVVSYYLTTRCNLNCHYCEDFGAQRNENAIDASYENALKILRIIREVSERIVFTGGEPLLYSRIEDVLRAAKLEMRYKHITMISNGYLLKPELELLDNVDHIVVSFDSLNLNRWHHAVGISINAAEAIFRNVEALAKRQDEKGFVLSLNCVITKDGLDEVFELVDFCEKNQIRISFSPQATRNWPDYELITSKKFLNLLEYLIKRKRSGSPIIGSKEYFQLLLDFKPYRCYPMLAPRVFPNGDLIYPCRPIEKEADIRGGRGNLLAFGSWRETVESLCEDYGPAPQSCGSCFQQCYAEPSLMQAAPIAYLYEKLRYKPSRNIELAGFTPG